MIEDFRNRKVSPYVIEIKDWKITNALTNLLKVGDEFNILFETFVKDVDITLTQLLQIHKILKEVQRDLHTVFRRLVEPKKKKFEKAAKFTPSDNEMRLIITVELLLHKLVIVQRQKSSIEFYSESSDGFLETYESISSNMVKIKALFDEARRVMRILLPEYKNNILLVSWILENRDKAAVLLNESIEVLLVEIFGREKLAEAYLKVGEYFLASGWGYRAKSILAEGAKYWVTSEQYQPSITEKVPGKK